MKHRLGIFALISITISACATDGKVRPTVISQPTGPLPGDPVLTDDSTGETLAPILRNKLAFGQTEIPFSDEKYNIKRHSLLVSAGTSYSIDISNHEDSSSAATASMRTELCPEAGSGNLTKDLPRISTRTFEYAATQDCELIFDINGVHGQTHKLQFHAHTSVADGLLQDRVSHEPNNSPNSAYPVNPGVRYTSSMRQYDSTDYYSLKVKSGQTFTISAIEQPSNNSSLQLELFDSSLNLLDQKNVESTSGEITLSTTFKGLMLLKFHQKAEGTESAYSFSVVPVR